MPSRVPVLLSKDEAAAASLGDEGETLVGARVDAVRKQVAKRCTGQTPG